VSISVLPAAAQVRVKDIAGVQGARGNQLVGFGLVVGLEGTGDSNSATFTPQAVANALQKFGTSIPAAAIKVKNVASVMVTAELPSFVKNGSRIDVTVSSMGDARSLQGGLLLQTPLIGGDGKTYAMAQGPLTIGGFNFSAGGSQSQKNHVNVGRIPKGASVEREVPTSITDGDSISLTLKEPDLTTASRIAEAINKQMPQAGAQALDAYTVKVAVPAESRGNLIAYLSKLESISVTPDISAKIVVNERTGTVVIGGEVKLSACSIAHGNIQVKVDNTPVVAIPPPFSKDGKPVVVPQKDVTVKESKKQLAAVPSTTSVDQLVKALNALGVSPRDLINILMAMHQAGGITAEIEIQ
jgi:flagellar P-ring protein precursor FlgI